MPWRDILATGAYRAGLYNLRRGGGYPSVFRTFESHFPEEDMRDIVEATRRTVAAYKAGQTLGRAGRVNPLPPGGAPWLLGAGEHPEENEDCRWRYDVTAEFTSEYQVGSQWVEVRELDSDHSLTPQELRDLVERTVQEWASRRDTLPGGGSGGPAQLASMRVNFVFRC